MNDDLDWGPGRPTAVSWAGVLMFLLGLFQLAILVIALVLDAPTLLQEGADALAVVFYLAFAVLQLVSAVGVIRLGRGWWIFAVVLAGLGAVLQALNLVGAGGEMVLILVNLAFTLVYVVIFVLLLRTGPAFE